MATKRPPIDPPRTTAEFGVDPLFGDPAQAQPPTDDLSDAVDVLRSNSRLAVPPAEAARVEFQTNGGPPHTRMLGDSVSVGRHTDNDIQLLDPEVSKAHLVLRRTPAGYTLEDLGSANGTLVNGVTQTRCRLQDGDVIVVGNSTLRFKEPRRKAQVGPATSSPPARSPAPIASSLPPMPVPPAVRPPMRPGVAPPGSTPPAKEPAPAPLTSFAEMRRSDPVLNLPSRQPPPVERTSVTLIPEGLLSASGGDTSVFTEQPAELAFQDLAAIADERALKRDYERLKVAFDLFTGVGLETDLEVLGQAILKKIRGVLPSDSAVIMLRDASVSDELVALASWSEKNQPVQIPRAIVERVLQTKGGLLTSDAQVDSQLRRSETIVGARIRSALCVPLVARGDVLGVIHLSSTSLAGAYGEKDLELLRAIAQPAALAVANARLRRKVEEEAATRAELSRFLSPALVEKAVNNELDLTKAGDLVQATVLFSDIRGFTTISDGARPEHIVSMLNEYFDAMVEVVFAFGGTLDKFLGDGMMAVWGTPVQARDDAIRAVKAANAMRRALRDIVNAARTGRGEMPLSVGYGIATGRVVAGAMGARRRLDFTVIGDTVNLSSRLCGQAKAGQILVDEVTNGIILGAGLETTALEPRQVKGVARPVPVFDVHDDAEQDPFETASIEFALPPTR
jgi:adenylate cyclase